MKEKNFFAIAIVGPTASGKTGLSLSLAQTFPCEIISADSRQFYKYLDIGTAKPTPAEQKICTHHFIDILSPDEEYNAGKFGEDAAKTVEEIFLRKKIPLIVGGSGLYISALCEGIFQAGETDTKEIRAGLSERLAIEGKEKLFSELEKIDPASAEKYSDKNPVRIIRALEYFLATGEKFSDAHKTKKSSGRNFSTYYFALDYERAKLYERINLRCEEMWQNGLVEETENILSMGYSPELQSLNTVGYKEAIAFLQKKISSDRALELIMQNTRRYAKRQLTWFQRNEKIRWFSDLDEAEEKISLFIKEKIFLLK